jgi:hypothetical protein
VFNALGFGLSPKFSTTVEKDVEKPGAKHGWGPPEREISGFPKGRKSPEALFSRVFARRRARNPR